MKLMSVGGHGAMAIHPSQNLTPIHYIAVLDPMADWFIRWTVSQHRHNMNIVIRAEIWHCL